MTEYDKTFFERRAQHVNASAANLIPIVNNLIHPKSVLDVGCGQGEWLMVWQENGVKNALGVDGEYVNKEKLLVPKSKFLAHNLETPLALNRKYDLVMSLEVAEHLDKEFAEIFIDSLIMHSDVILFSAAIPGQGGTHHVNEEWPSYWLKFFTARGYDCYDVLRQKIWNNKTIDISYRQNSMVYATKEAAKRLGLPNTNTLLDIVHPELFELRRVKKDQPKPTIVKPPIAAPEPTLKQKVKKVLKASPAAPIFVQANKIRRKVKSHYQG